jgi:hypothetical protein
LPKRKFDRSGYNVYGLNLTDNTHRQNKGKDTEGASREKQYPERSSLQLAEFRN